MTRLKDLHEGNLFVRPEAPTDEIHEVHQVYSNLPTSSEVHTRLWCLAEPDDAGDIQVAELIPNAKPYPFDGETEIQPVRLGILPAKLA